MAKVRPLHPSNIFLSSLSTPYTHTYIHIQVRGVCVVSVWGDGG